jgi:hypothetical protein
MKNATYVDQSDTIRTLTEEEMAVVSGGSWQDINNRILAEGNRFAHSRISDYISRDPSVNALTFRTLTFWRYY